MRARTAHTALGALPPRRWWPRHLPPLLPPLPSAFPTRPAAGHGHYSLHSTRPASSGPEPRYNYNPDPFGTTDPDPGSSLYPLRDAEALARYREPPRRVRMLARDFIHDSLYNPHYGYFSTQVEIFDPDKARGPSGRAGGGGIDFERLSGTRAFEEEIQRRYGHEGSEEDESGGAARQVWHTPTELFKPYYAQAIANSVASTWDPAVPLRIYEIGAGTGSLLCGVLSHLRSARPDLYATASYTTLEISPRLAGLQRSAASAAGHGGKTAVRVRSALADLDPETDGTDAPCVVLATEVLDNLPRDVVRYSASSGGPVAPLQGVVSVDAAGEFHEHYAAAADPLLSRFLDARAALAPSGLSRPPPVGRLSAASPSWRRFRGSLPFAGNLTEREFAPTGMFKLLENLRDAFPNHRLVFSDFSSLPDAIRGHGAPVVQTRYKGVTVPCTTYLVSPGFFDIFFPTDFELLAALHSHLMVKAPAATAPLGLKLYSHADFLKKWGQVEKTRCRDGTNPMLDYYENVMFAVSEGF